MSNQVDPIVVTLRAEIDRYNRAIKEASGVTRKEFGAIEGSVGKMEAALQRSGVTAADAMNLIKRATAGLSLAAFTKGVSNLSDTWTDYSGRLRVALGETADVEGAMKRLTDTAYRTYSSFENTAEGFLQSSLALRELGYSTQQQLDYTEAMNNALVVSGAKQQAAEQVMNALSKAMATGSLRGEELNTVLARGQRVAQATAKELGVTTNQLRQLGQDGRITSTVLYSALTKEMETLRREADSMAATVQDGFQQIRTAALEYVGTSKLAHEATTRLADTLVAISKNFGDVATAIGLVAAVMGGRYVTSLGKAALGTIAKSAGDVRATQTANALASALMSRLVPAFATTSLSSYKATEAVTRFGATAAMVAGRGLSGLVNMLGGPAGIAVPAFTVGLGSIIVESERTNATLEKLSATADETGDKLDTAQGNASNAADGVKSVGKEAATAEGKVRSFAGAVGDAAQKLYELAKARQAAAIAELEDKRREASLEYSDLYSKTSEGRRARAEGNSHLNPLQMLGKNLSVIRDDLMAWTGLGPSDDDLKEGMGRIKERLNKLDDEIARATTNLEQFASEAGGGGSGAGDASSKALAKHRQTLADLEKLKVNASGKELKAINAKIAREERIIANLEQGVSESAAIAAAGSGAAEAAKKRKDIEAQFQSDMAGELQRTLAAQSAIATAAEEQAKFERQALEASLAQYKAEVQANKDYSAAQKAALIKAADQTAGYERQRIKRDEEDAIKQRTLEALRENDRYEHDALQTSADLAETRLDSLEAERRILDWMEQREKAELQAAIAAGKIADEKKAQAHLEATQAARRMLIDRRHESPLEKYQRDIAKVASSMDDQYQSIAVDSLQMLNDGLTDAIMNAKDFGDVFSNVAKQVVADLIRIAIQQTIVNNLVGALSNVFGGGNLFGGGKGASGAGIVINPDTMARFGKPRASGDNFTHGGIYRVGEAGPETIALPRGAKIIPNTRMDAASRNVTNVTQVLKLDLSHAVLTPDLLAQMNQMAQGAAVGGAMAGANLAQNNIARRSRNRIR